MFLKKAGRDEFRHAGSIEAANDDLALVLAREGYARRAEGEAMWLVDRAHIVQGDREFLAPNADKPHRHNDGTAVAAHRKAHRAAQKEATSPDPLPQHGGS